MSGILCAQDKNAVLWKIESKNNSKVSYLFGTIHSKNKNIFNLDSALIPLIKSSELFVPELDISTEAESMDLSALLLPEGTVLKDLYSANEYALIKREFERRSGLEIEEFEQVHPSGLIMMLKDTLFYNLPRNLDHFLIDEAKKNKVEVVALETVDEQINYIKRSQNIEHIYNLFSNKNYYDSVHNALLKSYIAEDAAKMLNISRDGSAGGYDMDILINERNQIMISKIDSLIRVKSTFVAIGAAHLYGEKGVINGLEKLGYSVSPIHNKKIMHQVVSYNFTWKNFEGKSGNFLISFPETPEIKNEKNGHTYNCEVSIGEYMPINFVLQEQISSSFKAMRTPILKKMLLMKVKSSFEENIGLKSLGVQNIQVEGYPGLACVFRTKDMRNVCQARFILVEDKLYTIMVIAEPVTEDIDGIENFMNSFKILN
jgi:uncharacterized protein YbaP (TraB family)